MRRVLTTVLAVALLVGLGALAVLALPNANAPLAGAPAVSAAAPEFQDAPAATQNFNHIAMPLNAQNQFTTAGFTFDADGLSKLVGSGVRQVARFNAEGQSYDTWTIDPEFGGSGTNFPLAVGGAYWLLLDSTATNIVSFVGDVPAQGSVTFTFVTGSPCKFNEFSLPLDQSAITNADQLATALSATQVAQWNAAGQKFDTWTIDPEFGGSGTNFTAKIGYPFAACLATGAPTQWP
jgi:hypothetical protein